MIVSARALKCVVQAVKEEQIDGRAVKGPPKPLYNVV